MFFGKNTSHGKDATVNDLNAWGLDSATDDFRVHEAERLVDTVLVRARQPLIDAVTFFFKKPISPFTLMAFGIALLGIVRELGRQLLQRNLATGTDDQQANREIGLHQCLHQILTNGAYQ